MISQSDDDRRWEEGFTPVVLEDSRIERLLAALRESHGNGSAILCCFTYSDDTLFDLWGDASTLRRLLALPTRLGLVPELGSVREAATLVFARSNSLTLDGELATTLVAGGAYGRFPGTERQAKVLGHAFCDALFGDRFGDIIVSFSREPWSDWFYDVAWDKTWVIRDLRQRRISLLCVTDTD